MNDLVPTCRETVIHIYIYYIYILWGSLKFVIPPIESRSKPVGLSARVSLPTEIITSQSLGNLTAQGQQDDVTDVTSSEPLGTGAYPIDGPGTLCPPNR